MGERVKGFGSQFGQRVRQNDGFSRRGFAQGTIRGKIQGQVDLGFQGSGHFPHGDDHFIHFADGGHGLQDIGLRAAAHGVFFFAELARLQQKLFLPGVDGQRLAHEKKFIIRILQFADHFPFDAFHFLQFAVVGAGGDLSLQAQFAREGKVLRQGNAQAALRVHAQRE